MIDVVAGAQFGPAAGVLRLHAVALLASFVAAVFGYALLAVGRYRAVLAMNAAALVVVAVAGALLIPAHGARGAAVATVLSEGTLALVGAVALVRSGALGRGFSLRVVPRVAVAAAVAVGAAVLGRPPVGGRGGAGVGAVRGRGAAVAGRAG